MTRDYSRELSRLAANDDEHGRLPVWLCATSICLTSVLIMAGAIWLLWAVFRTIAG